MSLSVALVAPLSLSSYLNLKMVAYNAFALRSVALKVDKYNSRVTEEKYVFVVATSGDDAKVCKMAVCDDETTGKLCAAKAARGGCYGNFDLVDPVLPSARPGGEMHE